MCVRACLRKCLCTSGLADRQAGKQAGACLHACNNTEYWYVSIKSVFSAFVGVSHRHLSDHLSELVENTLNDLEHSKVMLILNSFYAF